MELDVLVLSKPGARGTNEDACGFWAGSNACFCVLSDGVGGHSGGAHASKLVVAHTLEWFRQTPECNASAVDAALRSANDALLQAQRRDGRLSSMRATVVVLAIDIAREIGAWGHVGDSRLYCFRHQQIVEQTKDHSVVQTMVDAGYMSPQQLRASPQRSALLAALGHSQVEPEVNPRTFLLRDGDIFLLCSDGLWECVEESEMELELKRSLSSELWLQSLENRVLSRAQDDQDNYSAIVVHCAEVDKTVDDASISASASPSGQHI